MHIHINVSSHIIFLVWKRNCRTSSHIIFCVRSGTAEIQVAAYSLCGSGTVELQVTEYSVCGSGPSSHRIFCMWNISGSLYNGPNDTRAQGPQAPGSKPSWMCCSILAMAPTGIFVCFLRYNQAVTNQLTYDKDPDIRQTS